MVNEPSVFEPSKFYCILSAPADFPFLGAANAVSTSSQRIGCTVKILKIGTPEIITIIVLQLEQLDFTVQHCVQKMQTE